MERKYSIDILRIISAIAVIVIHVVSAPLVSIGTDDLPLVANLNLVHQLMNWSVPVFFMITGYCMFLKPHVTYKYCFSHVLKYCCVLFTVGLFYALLEEVFVAKSINFTILIRSLLNVVSGNLWEHMWYVYAIIGIYLIMPVLHYYMGQDKKNIYILTTLLFLFNIFFPTIEDWFPIGVTIPFGKYLFYVCFGGLVAKQLNSLRMSIITYLGGALSLIWISFDKGSHEFGYSHIAICFIAMSVFLLISSMKIQTNRSSKFRNVHSNKPLVEVSQCTWGIYLLHPLFINIAIKLLKIDILTSYAYFKLFIFTLVILLVSFISTYILRKIPIVKKLF